MAPTHLNWPGRWCERIKTWWVLVPNSHFPWGSSGLTPSWILGSVAPLGSSALLPFHAHAEICCSPFRRRDFSWSPFECTWATELSEDDSYIR
jgi:hypothetical protein